MRSRNFVGWMPLSWLATCFCLVYIVSMLGLFILRLQLTEWPPILSLANSFLPFLFLPLIFVLPVSFLTRSKIAALGSVSVLAIFIFVYGPFFLPRFETQRALVNRPLTFVNYNLSPAYPEAGLLLAALRAESADIVALEELSPPLASSLREQSRILYPYQIIEPEISTTALLSRYPILRSAWLKLAGQERPVIHATIDVNSVEIEVLAIHPPPPGLSWFRSSLLPTGQYNDGESEINELIQRLAVLNKPLVVLGDFNLSDQSHAYTQMTKVFKDAFREAGWGFGFTFPNDVTLEQTRIGQVSVPGPFVRLDYIFYSADFRAQEAHVTCKSGSDHCYLVAQLTSIM
ncbi:MAG: hypothetical protein EXR62_15605 [Chloroflexi bacterium]|nr:hypothetical protein [Chloroflexota bacterium]